MPRILGYVGTIFSFVIAGVLSWILWVREGPAIGLIAPVAGLVVVPLILYWWDKRKARREPDSN